VLASDADIDWLLRERKLQVTPTDPELIQPASIDLRLDRWICTYVPFAAPLTDWPLPVIDPGLEQSELMTRQEIPEGDSFVLPPRGFALAATLEKITIDGSLAAKLEGKSSLGRLGLLVHATAGWIDPGFSGHITLELYNAAPYPLRLWPGMKIAQMAVLALHTGARRPYGSDNLGSHYQNQPRGPQPSSGWRRFRTWPTEDRPPAA
jgi:dCTP deaminase